MISWLWKRLVQACAVVVGVVMLVFVLARLSGDPASLYVPLLAPDNMREAFRAKHGLDRPLGVQFADFLKNALRGDMGESLWQRRPALGLVLERLPLTLALATLAIGLSVALALVLGTLAALRPLSLLDRAVMALSLVGLAVPSFWLALVLILTFSVRLGWLPTSGTGGPRHLLLPLVTLAWGPMGRLAQVVRCSVLNELSAPYIVAVRAKGLSERALIVKHVLRNALMPVVAVAGRSFVGMANGAVIVETVFGWPGIGKLTVDAIARRDFAVIQAVVLVVAVLVVTLNLALDCGYALLDPRVGLGSKD